MILIDFPNKKGWCHLASDNLDELHKFALEIGVKRYMFHNPRGKNKPHYDIRGKKEIKAIEKGAIRTSSKDIVNMLNQKFKK
ncbi:MAG: DUF4031 domain-containing protein [Nanoarchaeota archaeon]